MAYTVIDTTVLNGLLNQRATMRVPLDHTKPEDKITIAFTVTQKYDAEVHGDTSRITLAKPKPLAYLQGGPGFPCAVPLANSSYTKVLLDKGYQVVWYDQRGTGLSTPIDSATLLARSKDNLDVVAYLKCFRADSIVEDMELVRQALGVDKWLLLGQSYGGFCAFTYLSRHHASLSEVFITGGVPPVGCKPVDVYPQTYARTTERNEHYYRKYPQDIARVLEIAEYLRAQKVTLPNGGVLSVERFQQLGLRLGATGGTDGLHQIVTELWHILQTVKKPTYGILAKIESQMSFDTNPLYALFQEAIYCDGPGGSDWGAERTRYLPGHEPYIHRPGQKLPLFFTGEMVFKSMYEDYAELRPLKDVAYALHSEQAWPRLYDIQLLRSITWEKVPIVAATYYHDQYVDFAITMSVKRQLFGTRNLRQHITSEHFHNGLRAAPEKVLGALFALRDCDVD